MNNSSVHMLFKTFGTPSWFLCFFLFQAGLLVPMLWSQSGPMTILLSAWIPFLAGAIAERFAGSAFLNLLILMLSAFASLLVHAAFRDEAQVWIVVATLLTCGISGMGIGGQMLIKVFPRGSGRRILRQFQRKVQGLHRGMAMSFSRRLQTGRMSAADEAASGEGLMSLSRPGASHSLHP